MIMCALPAILIRHSRHVTFYLAITETAQQTGNKYQATIAKHKGRGSLLKYTHSHSHTHINIPSVKLPLAFTLALSGKLIERAGQHLRWRPQSDLSATGLTHVSR